MRRFLFIALLAAPLAAQAPNTLTAAERAAGWKLLFDGTSLSGWRQYQADSVPAAWQIVDGHIVKARGTRDIVSREEFGDFELTFDWKLTVAGNAGVFYKATEEYDRVYWSGPEYQLLDNILAADNRTPLTRAGAVYGFYPAPDGHDKRSVYDLRDTVRGPDGKPQLFAPRGRGRGGAGADTTPRPRVTERQPTAADVTAFLKAGEWNVAKIVVKGSHIEHWLNGFKLAEYQVGSADWTAKYDASKFKPYPNFARAAKGRVGLQGDHAGILALRNIKIRELK